MRNQRRIVTIDPLWTPARIPGVVHCWYRAKMMGLTDGDAVGTWADVSGNGRDMTQSVAGNKPTFKTNAMNGTPAVYFTTDDKLAFGNIFSALTQGEVFVVFKRDADPPAGLSTEAGFWSFTADGGSASIVPWSDGTIYDGWGTNARKTTVNPVPSMAVPCVYNVTSVSGEWTNRLNGVQLFTTATNTVGFPSASYLGFGPEGGGYYYKGHFSELLILNRKLSPSERLSVNRYISREHRLSLPI